MAKTEVVWSPEALQRLDEISDYIAIEGELLRAAEFAEKLLESTDQLEAHPLSGGPCPENPMYRQLVVNSYRVIYEPSEGRAEVLTIISPDQSAIRIMSAEKK